MKASDRIREGDVFRRAFDGYQYVILSVDDDVINVTQVYPLNRFEEFKIDTTSEWALYQYWFKTGFDVISNKSPRRAK